mgnify:FL=1
MPIIEKLRNLWTRYFGGFNSLSRAEQVEILHGAWTFALACGVLACIGTLVMILARLIESLV